MVNDLGRGDDTRGPRPILHRYCGLRPILPTPLHRRLRPAQRPHRYSCERDCQRNRHSTARRPRPPQHCNRTAPRPPSLESRTRARFSLASGESTALADLRSFHSRRRSSRAGTEVKAHAPPVTRRHRRQPGLRQDAICWRPEPNRVRTTVRTDSHVRSPAVGEGWGDCDCRVPHPRRKAGWPPVATRLIVEWRHD
jgi:hypothetical protein